MENIVLTIFSNFLGFRRLLANSSHLTFSLARFGEDFSGWFGIQETWRESPPPAPTTCVKVWPHRPDPLPEFRGAWGGIIPHSPAANPSMREWGSRLTPFKHFGGAKSSSPEKVIGKRNLNYPFWAILVKTPSHLG